MPETKNYEIGLLSIVVERNSKKLKRSYSIGEIVELNFFYYACMWNGSKKILIMYACEIVVVIKYKKLVCVHVQKYLKC